MTGETQDGHKRIIKFYQGTSRFSILYLKRYFKHMRWYIRDCTNGFRCEKHENMPSNKQLYENKYLAYIHNNILFVRIIAIKVKICQYKTRQ